MSVHEFSQLLVLRHLIARRQGMTSHEERAYFEWYARHLYTGRGEIVDLGCWLGSTTIALAIGLARNPKAGSRTIHSFDQFVWKASMDREVVETSLEGRFRPGESFREEFERRTSPWKDRIRVHAGDLTQVAWSGDEIEFLLIDAMKSWELTNHILRAFFPSLVPGVSLVLHQDFAHYYTPWIHLVMYRLRDCFELVYDVPRSGSAVFRLQRPIPAELLRGGLSFASFSTYEVGAAFDHSSSLVARDKRANILAAKVMLYVHAGEERQARQQMEWIRREDRSAAAALADVERFLPKAD